MHILNSLLPLPALNLPDSRPQLPTWQLGQVLQAIVLKPTEGGKAALDIGGNRLQAHSDLPLRSGEVLTVRVERQGTQTLLRVLNQFQPEAATQANALRETIPKQEPLAPLFANLQMLAGKDNRAADKLPQSWLQMIRQIVQTLAPARQAATADGLSQAMQRSGMFLERRLAASGTQPGGDTQPLQQDLKAALLRLGAVIAQTPDTRPGAAQNTPGPAGSPRTGGEPPGPGTGTTRTDPPLPETARVPVRGALPQAQPRAQANLNIDLPLEQLARHLHRQVESGVARIQLNQLNSLPTDELPRHILTFELPIREQDHTDLWSLRLEQELPASGQQAAAPDWTVHLAFDLDGLGPVHARVRLHGEAVAANFWAEHDATATLIQDRLPLLDQGLRASGLLVQDLNCFHGPPPQPRGQASPRGIVNIKV